MTWVIPHPDAAGTLYNASDDYKWFRVVAGFQKGVCSDINNGTGNCGALTLRVTGDGQFVESLAEAFIKSTDDTELQTAGTGTNKIMMSPNTVSGNVIFKKYASSDANYKYVGIYVDLRTYWRIGQAISKLSLRARVTIASFCTLCNSVYVPWQTDWLSADFTNIISIGSGNTTLSLGGLRTLFEFDMDPDGAAI